jgi:hypothetical protein
MALHYTIVFITPNPAIQEKIAVGLLLFNRNEVYYKFSPVKLQLVKNILGKDVFKLVQDGLKSLSAKVAGENNNYHLANGFRLFKHQDIAIDFTAEYINYLSRYKNNVISYTEPLAIAIEPSEEILIKLFNTFIGEAESDKSSVIRHERPIDRLKQNYHEQLTKHFIEDKTISYNEVKGLFVPVKVDLVGKNEKDVFVQSIFMEAKPDTIIQEISTFYLLKDTYKKNNSPMQDFVLAAEPPKEQKKQHELWKHLFESKEFNYVDVSEAEKIIEYAEEHNVKPVFGEVNDDFPF